MRLFSSVLDDEFFGNCYFISLVIFILLGYLGVWLIVGSNKILGISLIVVSGFIAALFCFLFILSVGN